MRKILPVGAVVIVGFVFTLALIGCGVSAPGGPDKTGGDSMGSKMSDDKMGDKMHDDKMAGKMAEDKMGDDRK
jgi:hypothetical protein